MENKVTMEKSKAQGGEKQLPNETAPSRPGALGLPQAFFVSEARKSSFQLGLLERCFCPLHLQGSSLLWAS